MGEAFFLPTIVPSWPVKVLLSFYPYRPMNDNDPILAVRHLQIGFPNSTTRETVLAVKGIDFDLQRGEILGIVGESG